MEGTVRIERFTHSPHFKAVPLSNALSYVEQDRFYCTRNPLQSPKRQITKHYYDQSATQLPSLVMGQPVRVKTHPQKPPQQLAPRSYLFDDNLCTYRRNRIHVRDAIILNQTVHQFQSQETKPVPQTDPAQFTGPVGNRPTNRDHDLGSHHPKKAPSTSTPSTAEAVTRTKSGRIVKPNSLPKIIRSVQISSLPSDQKNI